VIFGIGTDIVSTTRIAGVWSRYGAAFAHKILADEEWDRFSASTQPASFLAKRFAAKEAFSKALGTGIRHPVLWRNIRVEHDELGRPAFDFHPELAEFLAQRSICYCHLSISDEKEMAAAFVILEK
jgi:holo-[acyl-carrier protein] synthase